ncbi:membrane protein [Planobispora rosea]|uniref:Membrane protein n=1 Tax=Planobispora rosea TaxID=35762 RepID=A0A8J3S7K6_PLARO|nr:DUF389 domain-containing protein [Planobispora rosea]GGS94896.1 membrane protein [Planobispora rosea]GIH87447.1 membrane protein [Planobispora rosea]
MIVPAERTGEVSSMLTDCVAVTNIVVLPGAAHRPAGDVVFCDVAREAASELLERLQELGLDQDGSIAVENVDVSLSETAAAAQEAAPGYGDDAVVWEEIAQRASDDARLTWVFLAFIVIATQIAGIGVLLDSPILIVGAMVLGPEFGPVAAVCFGLLRRDLSLVGAAVRTLAAGFALAIVITFAAATVSRWWGWIDPSWLDAVDRELEFIVKPDKWSFIVALLAGAAGVLSITGGKSSALVGVFISVTTIPAAGSVAVAVALTRWDEVTGSLAQLAVNLAGMVLAGLATLLIQRVAWRNRELGVRP